MERQYLDPGREVDRWARQFVHKDRPTRTREMLSAITHEIHKRFTYVARHEAGTQDPVMTLKLGSGSCRDFALLMIEAVRSLGLAARFVSGYLYVPEGRARPISAAATPMPGRRSICRAPAGSNSIRPTASSAIAI
jgi:Transglutaminase-like enzymes, putative cysteine proteases